MGQKVNPYGMRLGIIRECRSKWFALGRTYSDQLVEDLQARQQIHKMHRHAAISGILIERAAGATTVTIESAKPGIIIGRGGGDVDRLRKSLDKLMSGRVRVNVEETKRPEINAQLVAEEIAGQIERRASIRRAMGQAIERAMRSGADGIRVQVSGRLGGAEIARTERVGPEGSVPLHTLRADVWHGVSEAKTGYGHIGVQVLISHGLILPPQKEEAPIADLDEELATEDSVGAESAEAAPAADEAVAADPVVVEAPVVEAPVVEAPVVEAPVVEAPAVEAPVVEAPVVEAPVVEAPVVEAPVVEAPVVEAPVVEAAAEEAAVVDVPENEATAEEDAGDVDA